MVASYPRTLGRGDTGNHVRGGHRRCAGVDEGCEGFGQAWRRDAFQSREDRKSGLTCQIGSLCRERRK